MMKLYHVANGFGTAPPTLIVDEPCRETDRLYYFAKASKLPSTYKQLHKTDMKGLRIFDSPQEALADYLDRQRHQIEQYRQWLADAERHLQQGEALLAELG